MDDIRGLFKQQREFGEDRMAHSAIFPEFFNPASKKYKILFIQPKINRYQLYTMIGPALVMNANSERIACMITAMDADNKELDTFTDKVQYHIEDIKMAHMIVFPFSHEDLTINRLPTQDNPDGLSIYNEVRKYNPLARIVYGVDFNFYDLPKTHYNYTRIQKNMVCIENNIKQADYVLVQSEKFAEYLMIKLKIPGIRAIVIPSYFGGFHFTDIDFTDKTKLYPATDKVRIGIPSDLFRREDIQHWKDIYLWLQNDFKNKVELVYYGYHPDPKIVLSDKREGKIDNKHLNEKLKGRQKPPFFTGYTRTKRNDYQYHFKNFWNLNLDVCLFLYEPREFWTVMGTDVDLLYALNCEIPVITNMPMPGFPDFSQPQNVKNYLTDIITEMTKHGRRMTTNMYKQTAVNFRDHILPEIFLTKDNGDQVEQQFLTILEGRDQVQ